MARDAERPALKVERRAERTSERMPDRPEPDVERQPELPALEPFSPLPSVVGTTPSTEPTVVGTNWDRAQVAAMAERMLTSFRSGRVDGQDEVRMQLRMLDAEVRVQIQDGRVVATLIGDGLEGLARTLKRELESRGLPSEITLEQD